MSAHHNLRSWFPLKTMLTRLGNFYKTYCNIYKTNTMATYHGGIGQLTDRDIPAHKTTDAEIEHAQEFHHVNTNDFEESEPNNPTRLTLITRELDDLCQHVLAGEGQPVEALHCIECKIQRLSIALCP